MGIWDVFLIGVGLSMDAFAVSICKGLSVGKIRPRHALIAGGWFGLFQALMPVLGYVLGVRFQNLIASVDHWITSSPVWTTGSPLFCWPSSAAT